MKDEELIIGYLENELSPSAKAAFELRLHSEPALKTEYKSYAKLHKSLQGMQKDEVLRAEIASAIQATTKPEKVRKFRPIFLFPAVAAAIALMVIISQLIQPEYNADYYQTNYPGYYQAAGPDRGEAGLNPSFNLAVSNYEAGNYPTAIQHFSEVPKTSKMYLESQLFLGSALLMAKRPADAVSPLEMAHSEPNFREYASWLLALAWLHQGISDSALPYLNQIANKPGPGYRQKEAKTILKTLEDN